MYFRLFFLLFVFLSFEAHKAEPRIANQNDNKKYTEQFRVIFEKITQEYVQDPDKQKMLDGALDGMISSLDPHSKYLVDDELQNFLSRSEGKFGGIGVELLAQDDGLQIMNVVANLPAQKAGLEQGDIITAVDGKLVKDLGANEAIKKIRGEVGTKVTLTVLKSKSSISQEVELERKIVKTHAVSFSQESNIGYVKIATFNENTLSELKEAFTKLSANQELEGIVLDLRNNPGGLLDQAVKVVDYFIDSGVIVSTTGKNGKRSSIFYAKHGTQKVPKVNIVALINSGSASAAEIVAGALQDHKRAIIMGTKSFGKGSVQAFFRLNPRSGMSITISKYYTPKGRCIQAEGISPDIVVEAAQVNYSADKKERKFFESSYSKHLPNDKKAAENDQSLNNDELKPITEQNMSELYKLDYQYARALDLLKSLYMVQSTGVVAKG